MPPESVAFDRAAEYYDETRGFPPGEEQAVAQAFARAGHLDARSHVLEIGIGTGRIALPLAALVRSVTGIDLARPMLDKLVAKRRGEPVSVIEGDATRLPLPPQSFDAVLAIHVLHLIPHWQDALAEVARVLRPGGRLLINGPEGDPPPTEETPFRSWWRAWETAVPDSAREHVGLSFQHIPTALEDLGWQPVDQETHRYNVIQTGQNFLDRAERRVWSRMWRMTDDQIVRGLAAVREDMAQRGIDPAQPFEVPAKVVVQAYLPPVHP